MFANVNEFTFKPEIRSDGPEALQVQDHWRELIHGQTGFLGFVSLDKGENHVIVVTFWESQDAARRWAEDPAWKEMQANEFRPITANWSITPTTVQAADLRNIAV